MTTNRIPPCVYCLRDPGETVDHIPPKLFFARPYPQNLLTVPSCRKCNSSFQADDEYTRFVVSVDLRSAKQEGVRRKLPAILRSLQRPDAKGFYHHLMAQIQNTTVLNVDGKPLGQTLVGDRGRINATGERIVRGLFFIEHGEPLPLSAKIRIGARPGIAAPNPVIQQFARMYNRSPDRRSKAIGDVFSYAVGFYPHFSIWFLLLYGHFSWLATISFSEAKSRTPPAEDRFGPNE